MARVKVKRDLEDDRAEIADCANDLDRRLPGWFRSPKQ